MNTNGNTYTVIYSTVLVVLVAAILAFVAMSLQDKQNENIKLETIGKLLGAASQVDTTFTIEEDADVLGLYADNIVAAFFVDGNGEKVQDMNTGKEDKNKIEVTTTSDLKAQNDKFKKLEEGQSGLLSELRLPVYIFDIKGHKVTVIPCYGAGLWGPIWGYLALDEDGKTIDGAIFDHKGETPGLGSKIADKPFYGKFHGKTFNMTGEDMFTVAKITAITEPEHSVDAISGATITSQALGKSINLWAKYYKPYLEEAARQAEKTAVSDSTLAAGTMAEPIDSVKTVAADAVETNVNVEE